MNVENIWQPFQSLLRYFPPKLRYITYGGARGEAMGSTKSLGFIIWEPRMTSNMEIPQMVVEIFH